MGEIELKSRRDQRRVSPPDPQIGWNPASNSEGGECFVVGEVQGGEGLIPRDPQPPTSPFSPTFNTRDGRRLCPSDSWPQASPLYLILALSLSHLHKDALRDLLEGIKNNVTSLRPHRSPVTGTHPPSPTQDNRLIQMIPYYKIVTSHPALPLDQALLDAMEQQNKGPSCCRGPLLRHRHHFQYAAVPDPFAENLCDPPR